MPEHSTLTLVFELFKSVAAIVGVATVVYTWLTYRRTQRWRAGDLAANLIGQLETDQELAFACRALDWGKGAPLIVPDKYTVLLEKPNIDKKDLTPTERGQLMTHDPSMLVRWLHIQLPGNPWNEPGGLIYRYCFDKLFAHLTKIYRALETKQIELEDLSDLKYWLQMIAYYGYAHGVDKDQVFLPFLSHPSFGYDGVIKLGKQLGVKWKTLSAEVKSGGKPISDAMSSFDTS